MKVTLSLVCAALAVASPLSAQTESAKTETAKAAGKDAAPAAPVSMDKVSYFIGTQIGGNIASNFKQQGIDINVDNFVAAIRDQFQGNAPKYKKKKLQQPI